MLKSTKLSVFPFIYSWKEEGVFKINKQFVRQSWTIPCLGSSMEVFKFSWRHWIFSKRPVLSLSREYAYARFLSRTNFSLAHLCWYLQNHRKEIIPKFPYYPLIWSTLAFWGCQNSRIMRWIVYSKTELGESYMMMTVCV